MLLIANVVVLPGGFKPQTLLNPDRLSNVCHRPATTVRENLSCVCSPVKHFSKKVRCDQCALQNQSIALPRQLQCREAAQPRNERLRVFLRLVDIERWRTSRFQASIEFAARINSLCLAQASCGIAFEQNVWLRRSELGRLVSLHGETCELFSRGSGLVPWKATNTLGCARSESFYDDFRWTSDLTVGANVHFHRDRGPSSMLVSMSRIANSGREPPV